MNKGVKEFHLHAQHTRREFLPGQVFDVWGYNDSMPGPTIENDADPICQPVAGSAEEKSV